VPDIIAIDTILEESTRNEYPLLTERVQSTFIDTIFIITLMFAFSAILDKVDNPPDWLRVAMFFSIWLMYEPVSTTLGCTLGNYVKGIRVRCFSDTARRINIFQALLRYVCKVLLGWISFLTINSTPGRRTIHDLVSGSVMIKV